LIRHSWRRCRSRLLFLHSRQSTRPPTDNMNTVPVAPRWRRWLTCQSRRQCLLNIVVVLLIALLATPAGRESAVFLGRAGARLADLRVPPGGTRPGRRQEGRTRRGAQGSGRWSGAGRLVAIGGQKLPTLCDGNDVSCSHERRPKELGRPRADPVWRSTCRFDPSRRPARRGTGTYRDP
jgi:hypothetical protein